MKRTVFISHSSQDKKIADAVCNFLEKHGVLCWMAPRDITPGKNYGAAIIDAISECEFFVLILSSLSNDSQQVVREVERAASTQSVVIPLRVEAVQPSKDLQFYVSSSHWLDAVTPPLDQHLMELLRAIEGWQKDEGQRRRRTPQRVENVATVAALDTPVPAGEPVKKRPGVWLYAVAAATILTVCASVLLLKRSSSPTPINRKNSSALVTPSASAGDPLKVLPTFPKASMPPVSTAVAKAEAKADTRISDKAPSSDPATPVPLNLGEVVKGRLAKSKQTKKYHYWSLDLPAGKYKFVLDLKRADDRGGNVGGDLQMIGHDGKDGQRIGVMNEIDYRHRSVFRINAEQPLQGILRYGNEYTISDYHLGVFRESDPLGGLFFAKVPPVTPITIGKPVTTPILDGDNVQMRDAYYSITLPAGDYKVSGEFRRVDQKRSNVGGAVSTLREDGDDNVDKVFGVNEIAPLGESAAKLSLADEEKIIFKVRAHYTKETAVFTVENWTE